MTDLLCSRGGDTVLVVHRHGIYRRSVRGGDEVYFMVLKHGRLRTGSAKGRMGLLGKTIASFSRRLQDCLDSMTENVYVRTGRPLGVVSPEVGSEGADIVLVGYCGEGQKERVSLCGAVIGEAQRRDVLYGSTFDVWRGGR